MKRIFHTVVVLSAFLCGSCSHSERQVQEVPVVQQDSALVVVEPGELPFQEKPLSESDIVLLRELLYDKYTLDDVYPYRDTVRAAFLSRRPSDKFSRTEFSVIRCPILISVDHT